MLRESSRTGGCLSCFLATIFGIIQQKQTNRVKFRGFFFSMPIPPADFSYTNFFSLFAASPIGIPKKNPLTPAQKR